MYYTNPSIGNWDESLKNKWKPFVLKEKLMNVSGFVYQLSSKNELFYNNIVLQYDADSDKETQLDWIVNRKKY